MPDAGGDAAWIIGFGRWRQPQGAALSDPALPLFSETVGAIYDAALDRELWFPALEKIRDFLGSKTAVLGSYDVLDRNPPFNVSIGYEPRWLELLYERYALTNPYMEQVSQMGSGEYAYGSKDLDYGRLRETVFYKEWLKPQGLYDGAVLIVDKTMTTISTLVAVRGEGHGVFPSDIGMKLDLLYPHVRRAVLIGNAIGALQGEVAEVAAVLDQLETGVVVLSASGGIVRTNAAAAAMLAAGAPVAQNGDRLVLSAATAQRALDRALASDVGDAGVAIPLDGSHILHLLPLDADRRCMIGAGPEARAVAFIRARASGSSEAVAALARQHGLTPRETEVLQALVDIGGIPMVAEVLGVTQTTVRTHVTNIFDKTGVRSQAGLIRLLTELQPGMP